MAEPVYGCPLEKAVGDALDAAGIVFLHESWGDPVTAELDFYVPDWNSHIEIKRFHTDRIAGQMSRSENVIVLQGENAVSAFCRLLKGPPK